MSLCKIKTQDKAVNPCIRRTTRSQTVSRKLAKNPLYNDLILDNIFSFLTLADLMKIRQVTKKWHNASQKHFETKSVLELKEKINPVFPKQLLTNVSVEFPFLGCTKTFNATVSRLFKRDGSQVKTLALTTHEDTAISVLQQILKGSSQLKMLQINHLDYDFLCLSHLTMKLNKSPAFKLSNLKSLDFELSLYDTRIKTRQRLLNWTHLLLKSAPNITTLKISWQFGRNLTEIPYDKTISENDFQHVLHKLEYLDLQQQGASMFLPNLLHISCSLKRLCAGCISDSLLVEKILQKHAKTLEFLQIKIKRASNAPQFVMPYLPKLKEMPIVSIV